MNNGSILLIKKARGPYKSLLDLPGGSLEHGEDIEDALIREIAEETGLSAKQVEWQNNLTTVVDFEDERGDISMYHIGLVYRVTEWSGELISDMEEEDSLGAEWFTLNDLAEDQLSPFARRIVQELA